MLLLRGRLAFVLPIVFAFVLAGCAAPPPALPETANESQLPSKPEPVILVGVPLEKLGLKIVLPENSGIKDPNIPATTEAAHQPVEGLSNGNSTVVGLSYVNNVTVVDTMEILYLQAVDLSTNEVELALFQLEYDYDHARQYSYSEISDKILYHKGDTIVLDVTFAYTSDFRQNMNAYITANKGVEGMGPPNAEKTQYADGTTVYKYDWMEPAFDYVLLHIKEMIHTA